MVRTPDSPLVGTWKLVSCDVIDRNGEVEPLYGPAPAGRLFYDASGNMSVQIMRGDRAPVRSRGNASDEADGVRAAFEGYQAYFSTYKVDAGQHLIHHKVLGSLFPNWTGTTQTRSYTFEGRNRLVLSSTPNGEAAASRKIVKLIWERLVPQDS